MATTDAKPGFRLPWSADRSEPDARAETTDEPRGDALPEALPNDQEIETPAMIDTSTAATDQLVTVDDEAPVSDNGSETYLSVDSTPTPTPLPAATDAVKGRKPNKFMADLTKAMQGAAETARADTLARYSADAKTFMEGIHASTSMEATDLRKQADDDVAAIREWSKAEIARIREETDERISHRKAGLEREIDAHAASIEGRIERVQRRVDAFEAEMAAFFERLIAEEDATRFAAMAESLPEPPPFDDDSTGLETADEVVAEIAEVAPEADAVAEVETVAEIGEASDLPAERAVVLEPWPETSTEAVVDAIDASLGGAETDAPIATDDQVAADETVDVTAEATEAADGFDPRLEALSLVPDFAAAEAEAAEFTPEESSVEEEIPMIGDDALAARLAGLVPDVEAGAESPTTRVVVTGLVSVASIAGFKRQLSRVAGVQSVGVSSGPDGEFLFAVSHGSEIVLRDAITTLPGFGARVTAEAEGELTVTAKDPEAEG
jgi:hypothetical protein